MIIAILFYSALLSGFLPWPLLCLRKKTLSFSHPAAPYLLYVLVATIYELVATQVFRINTSYWFQVSVLLEILSLFYFFKSITIREYSLFKKITATGLSVSLRPNILLQRPTKELMETVLTFYVGMFGSEGDPPTSTRINKNRNIRLLIAHYLHFPNISQIFSSFLVKHCYFVDSLFHIDHAYACRERRLP